MKSAHTRADLRRIGGSLFTGSLALVLAHQHLGVAVMAASPSHAASRSSVVARSDSETAAPGRRPISSRIALARQPIAVVPAAPEQPALRALVEPVVTDEPTLEPQSVAPVVVNVPPEGYETLESLATQPSVAATMPQPSASIPAEPALTAEPEAPSLVSIGGLSYPASVAHDLPTAQTPRLLSPAANAVTLRVSESQSEATQGTAIEWRLQLCNASSEPAHHVSAMLFFAEGIEPVAASGGAASLATGEVRFDPLATLGPGEVVELLVTGIGTEAGAVQYRAEVVSGDQPEAVSQDGVVRVTATR